jgi:hypothetical protein
MTKEAFDEICARNGLNEAEINVLRLALNMRGLGE